MNLLSREEFIKEVEVLKTAFALQFSGKGAVPEFPREVESILEEFSDVIFRRYSLWTNADAGY